MNDPEEIDDGANGKVWVVKPKDPTLNDVSYYFKLVMTDMLGIDHYSTSNFILRVGCPLEAADFITYEPIPKTFKIPVSAA